MKIAVTGACGHIGSRLIRDLPRYVGNLDFVLIDNFLVQRYPSLFDLPGIARYRFVEADVTEADLAPILAGVDVVVHLAAITDAARSFDHADEVERNNFSATEKVAAACAELGAAMVVASSTSVYGPQDDQVDETCGPEALDPQSPYAETKLREERHVQALCARGDLRAAIFRFGTIFGTSPGMRFHTAVNKFCWQAVMGQPLTIWRTAFDQKRPYLDLGDAVRAVGFAIENQLYDGRIYNAVTVNATVRTVVEEIANHVEDLTTTLVDSPIMNQLSYEVLNTRLSEKGFVPKGRLADGIADTLALLRNANARA